MVFMKKFTISSDENDNKFIPFDEFCQFLKGDDLNIPRLDNVRRTFKGYKGGIQTVNGRNSVPVSSVLRYLFSYSESSKRCERITKEIEKELLRSKPDTDSITFSSFELYKLIAKEKFHDSNFLFSESVYDENNILTLVAEHKFMFTKEEWLKICWFEHHFSRSVELKFQNLAFDELIRLKYEKFQSYVTFMDCGKKWHTAFVEHMKQKSTRIDAANIKNQIEIVAQKRHRPIIVDNEILDIFMEHCDESVCQVVAFDCIDCT